MSSLLNWIAITLSLVNTTLLLWLGLTVALNAERRTWGVWLISGGLLIGGLFFISHTAILGYGLTSIDESIDFWWHLGLLAALSLPYLWYVVVLWYGGFWENRPSSLYLRHRVIFALNTGVTLLSIALLWFANPFPSFSQVISLQLTPTAAVGEVPLMVITYILSTLINVGASLDVLWHPGPVRRMMGELARDRAKPWLLATSVMLMLVGLLITAVMVWVARRGFRLDPSGLAESRAETITWFDMAISGIIALAVVLLGQAIVRYEVFTGKTLPQRRFMRHWRNVVLLACGCGAVMGAALVEVIQPVYVVLVLVLLVTISYALFSQNSYVERERYLQHLRPFVVSQRLYEHLLGGSNPVEIDIRPPFQTLCCDVLGARVAYLAAMGPFASLVGSVLAYPDDLDPPTFSLNELRRQFTSPQLICIAVNPLSYNDAHWAIPLWSERGLIGVLLIGEKHNGGLYTREEIEIARASGERLIDTKASAELAQRLMLLQRQRLSESQVVDRRARRTLHDDILPRLHTAMLALNADKSAAAQAGVQALSALHSDIANLLRAMPSTTGAKVNGVGLIGILQELLSGELAQEFDEVTWEIDPTASAAARDLPPVVREVVYFAAREAMRNAARHGRGINRDWPLSLTIRISAKDNFQISIEDNGIGLPRAPSPGLSGNGLALHSTMMAVVGGTLTVENAEQAGTRVTLSVPLGFDGQQIDA